MSDSNIVDRPATDLVVVETLNAKVVFAPGGVEKIIEEITTKVRAIKTDISTKSGREAVASLAFKIARSKTALDDMGKNLVAELKKTTGAIDAERRTIRDRLDALKDEARKPLTDWENIDKLRIEQHEAAIGNIGVLAQFEQAEPRAADIRARLKALDAMPARDWQEFAHRGAEAAALARTSLSQRLATTERREAEHAELEKLRKEQAERAQKERDEKIAAEAAERARIEAETRAATEAKAAAERAAAEQRRIEQERTDAIARAEKAETDRKTADAKAALDRKAAEEKAARDQAAAIEAERRRVADTRAAEEAAKTRREANTKHRAKVNAEASAALLGFGIDNLAATRVIDAIADGSIPHVTISY